MSRSSLPAIFVLILAPFSAAAQTSETREYQVLANGNQVGSSQTTIDEDKNGTTTVKLSASVKFKIFFVTQTFESKSTETWKDGKLVALDGDSTENGTRTTVSIRKEAAGLVVRTNGTPRATLAEAWSSSFWKLPDKKFLNAKVPIVEFDTGNDMVGDLKLVAKESIRAAGKNVECYRFKLTGIPCDTDLWFDEYHRLVRQEWTERNQKMIVTMVNRK
jgi:hypothetical protein